MQIPYGKQDITEGDLSAVLDVLKSANLTQGPQIPKFENCIKQATNSNYAVAMNSATSALHAACLALGVGKGDVVWTTPLTFVASANCVLYCGATIDFVDIDKDSYNLSPSLLEAKLRDARSKGLSLPKVVIPVHLSGQPCEMEKIHALAKEYEFKIIEDASHAIGGRYKNQPIGNCEYSDITVFSFHPVKIVTTGEGGVATTNDKLLAQRMGLFRSHGITRDPSLMTEPTHGDWYYQQIELGFNYRMTDIQAALGVSQMDRLHDFVAKRHALANRYDDLLEDLPLVLPKQSPDSYSGRHLYVIKLRSEDLQVSHAQVFDYLRQRSIGVNVHYIPVHTQPYYQALGFRCGMYPNAEAHYERAMSIPLFYGLTLEQQDTVVETLRAVLK
ncbi:MAG: UDP-4-amino-4,6-dideoxy-N-acetyl-beta-L-altrosamine transaminase [Pseudomonadales bacterium]|nr:UDP-4-amino-4,6-dideoxy-N-acetyl-beta-L-altrosamine transaminase [Pseudomonadales bacterium]